MRETQPALAGCSASAVFELVVMEFYRVRLRPHQRSAIK